LDIILVNSFDKTIKMDSGILHIKKLLVDYSRTHSYTDDYELQSLRLLKEFGLLK